MYPWLIFEPLTDLANMEERLLFYKRVYDYVQAVVHAVGGI